ncbi:hypothetical protein D9619_011182 [Psilocybe cf. subviscida]|uniref:CCHC-type domain-containing protein n=1 Tax=Psilocybe cf. subviscida TaxID=2480587 RepID=A0A8H5F5C8_9AGAR|nr:hypothetical protein D9619_011182 [Psilocybe cf. subviscida]
MADTNPTSSAPGLLDQLMQQVTQLQQQIVDLQQQNHQLQQLQQQQYHHQPPPPHQSPIHQHHHQSNFAAGSQSDSVGLASPLLSKPSNLSSYVKVAPPEPFDGSMSKAESFLSQCLLYFYGRGITSDFNKVICALSFMKAGNADKWARMKIQQLDPNFCEEVSWEVFVSEFRATFGDPNPGATARHKMNQLKQGTSTADQYVADFRLLVQDTGFNDAALVEKFQNGLNSSLVDRIYNLPQMPSTLEGWISWALRLDRQWRQRESTKRTSVNPFSKQSLTPQSPAKPSSHPSPSVASPPPASQSTNAQQKSSDVVPMEVDSGWKSVRPLVCFKCRKPGHKAVNCRSTTNINAMDHEEIKNHFREIILKEEEEKKKAEGQSDQNFQ